MRNTIKTICRAVSALLILSAITYTICRQNDEIRHLEMEIATLQTDINQALNLCEKNETELYEFMGE